MASSLMNILSGQGGPIPQDGSSLEDILRKHLMDQGGVQPPQPTQMASPSSLLLHSGYNPKPEDFQTPPPSSSLIKGHPGVSNFLDALFQGFTAKTNPTYFQQLQEGKRQQDQFHQQMSQRNSMTAYEQAEVARAAKLDEEKRSQDQFNQQKEGLQGLYQGILSPGGAPPLQPPPQPAPQGGVIPSPSIPIPGGDHPAWQSLMDIVQGKKGGVQDAPTPQGGQGIPYPDLSKVFPAIPSYPVAAPPGSTMNFGGTPYHLNPDFDPSKDGKDASISKDSEAGKAAMKLYGLTPDGDGNLKVKSWMGPYIHETASQVAKKDDAIQSFKNAQGEYDETLKFIDKNVKDPAQAEALKHEMKIAMLRMGQMNGNTTEFFQAAKDVRKSILNPTSKENTSQWEADAINPDPKISGPAKQKLALDAQRLAAGRNVNQFTIAGLPKSGETTSNPSLHGDEFLSSLPDATSSQIKAIAEGRLTMPSANSRQSGALQLRQGVMQYDPDFNEQRFQTRKAFAPGTTEGKNIQNLNTAVAHMDQMMEAAKLLQNSNFNPTNEMKQYIKEIFGSNIPTNFAGVQQALAGEMARGLTGTATIPEIEELKASLSRKYSPSQLDGYGREMLQVLGKKLNSKQEQYEAGIGGKDKYFKVVQPTAKKIFSKYGQDPLGEGKVDGKSEEEKIQAAIDQLNGVKK